MGDGTADGHDDANLLKGSITEAIGKVTADLETTARGEKQKRDAEAGRPEPPIAPPRPGKP